MNSHPTDTELDRILADVELVPLLGALSHLLGDRSLLDPRLIPNPARLREPQCGYTAEQTELAIEMARTAIRRYLTDGPAVDTRPDALQATFDFLAGEPVDVRYVPLLAEEIALDGDDRAPQWSLDRPGPGGAPRRPVTAIVIGAGMSGIAAAHRLRQAGVPVTMVEKSTEFGGTWTDNTYPGCRVDIQNHMYSYSFAQRDDWPYYYSPQPVLRDYFRDVAERLGMAERVRFNTEVGAARWDEASGEWEVDVRSPSGPETLRATMLVSAVGQLNQPKYPNIDGLETFTGPAFHSARWNHQVDLAGRRVVVIGTGASACQLIPHVAEQAGQLTVMQRTAPWVLPVLNYRQEVPSGQRWVFENIPSVSRWYRVFLFWKMADGLLPAAEVDPQFPPTERSVSALNEMTRELMQSWIDLQTDGDPTLRAQMTPNYPIFAKRCIVDDGAYYAAMRRDNVRLCTDPIERIEPLGVRLRSGELIEADVLIFGTGFQASDFLTPMRVTGRGGVDLHEQWRGDARAYLGILVPNFPNLFCMYGPNTNIVVNGSIIYFSECEAHYITECARLLADGVVPSVEPSAAAHDRYNAWIDAGNATRAWTFSSVSSWYKNATGRSAQNWPFRVLEYWEQTRTPDLADLLDPSEPAIPSAR